MSKVLKSQQVGNMRFSLVEEADPLMSEHMQISIYATNHTGCPEIQKAFEFNQSEQATHYFNELVTEYAKAVK